MYWKELSKEASCDKFNEYCSKRGSNWDLNCPEEFRQLRQDILDIFIRTFSELNIDPENIKEKNNSYLIDYIFGLKLYRLLNESYNMSIRTASTEGVWRYLSLCVVPDVIDLRYGIDHPDRFWKKPKRLWFRVLWWYIHLSWQGDEESTKKVLKDNSTDEILQLVDRCGRDGYRVELYREIMKRYSLLDPGIRRKEGAFRKIMVMNTAKVQAVEPALVDGGEEKYVGDLCDYLGYKWG